MINLFMGELLRGLCGVPGGARLGMNHGSHGARNTSVHRAEPGRYFHGHGPADPAACCLELEGICLDICGSSKCWWKWWKWWIAVVRQVRPLMIFLVWKSATTILEWMKHVSHMRRHTHIHILYMYIYIYA